MKVGYGELPIRSTKHGPGVQDSDSFEGVIDVYANKELISSGFTKHWRIGPNGKWDPEIESVGKDYGELAKKLMEE